MASDEGTEKRTPEHGDETPAEANSGKSNGVPSRPVDQSSLVQRVRALTEALEGSDISELELNEDGARILIRRQLEAPVVSARPRGSTRGAGSLPRRTQAESAQQSGGGSAAGIAVLAPLTGVYYGSPSPAAPPFVSIGDTVQAGQVVCLVEAMKVFNEIKAEISGTVAAIVATGGQLVHRGDPLIRIQPI